MSDQRNMKQVVNTSGSERRKSLGGPLLMLGSAACWALGTVASKAVLDGTRIDPLPVLLIQLGGSVTVLMAASVVVRDSVRSSLRVGWTGVLEPGLAYLLSIIGLTRTSASSATVISAIEPLIVPFVAWILLRQRPPVNRLVLTIVAIAGALVAAWPTQSTTNRSVTGDALVFAGVVAAALYVVLSSRHAQSRSAVSLAAAQNIWAFGLVALLTLVFASFTAIRWPSHVTTIAAIAASGVLAYALPFTLYVTAIQRIDVGHAATFLTLIPVFGLGGAALFLSERPTLRQLSGAAIVVSTLLALQRPRLSLR